MTLNERVRANERSVANVCLDLTGLSLAVLLLTVCLIAFTDHQQRQISELKTELKKQSSEIKELKDRNTAQDVILNKLNEEYQKQEIRKAEEAKRIAEANNAGG